MPVHGGSGKEKQTFVFWLSLCMQAVLERVPWQSLPRQKPSLQSFPLRTTPWMPWHCLKWGKDSFSPLHTPGAAGGWNCLLLLQQNWGPFCPFPAKRQLGPSLEPGNPHLSVLQALGYKRPPRSSTLTVTMAPSMPWHEGTRTKAKLTQKTNKERGIREKIA